ncbi:TIM barrel protein [Saccharothrix variisporea]|uniref:Hydroxypyruvate isomerase n=1 Tax=Saccharothrix variisporea TaxID=543527 RepID=A0A495X7E4_9PSEU|nr:TIM barrel protein [Saccharothrix variisporea]RKT69075.1 hydroxypyruvate isomerase [Saccharothrix variisporea]
MYELSANLEWLFAERDDLGARVRAAAALGVPAVEIWGWRGRDVGGLELALRETGVVLQTMCVDPMGTLVDPATHEVFVDAVGESAALADRLGCPYLVITAGDERGGVSREEQRRAVVDALRRAAGVLDGYRAVLLLENLNSRVDHVGTFLDSTAECLDIVDEVGSPKVKVLYDHYHSLVMGERPEVVLAGRVDRVGHVQTADVPGRHEPGTGKVDWAHELRVLRDLGYAGRIGLECVPTVSTAEALAHIREHDPQ